MANYIIIGGDDKEYGPVTEADVRQWIAEGRLSRDSRVKAESDAEFRALSLYPEFADALRAQSAPGVIAPSVKNPSAEDPNWQAEVLAREPELKFGECLAAGWGFLGSNTGFLVGAVFLAWAANLPFVALSFVVPILGPLAMVCINAVIMGGFYLACLRRLRGEAVSPMEVFGGFKVAFVQLVLTGLVSGILVEFSACCLILPAIYLIIAWFFALPLVADKKIFFWGAMELSRKVVTRVWFEVFVLMFIAFLPLLIFYVFSITQTGKYFMDMWTQSGGNWQQLAQNMQSQNTELRNLTLRFGAIGQVVLLLNLFYVAGVVVRAYENLFGTRKP